MKRNIIFAIVIVVIIVSSVLVYKKFIKPEDDQDNNDSDGGGKTIVTEVSSNWGVWVPTIVASVGSVWSSIDFQMAYDKKMVQGTVIGSNYDWADVRTQPAQGNSGKIWDKLFDKQVGNVRFVIVKYIGVISALDGNFYQAGQNLWFMIFDTRNFQPSSLEPKLAKYAVSVNISNAQQSEITGKSF